MENEDIVLSGKNGRYSYFPDNESSKLGEGGSAIVYKGIQFLDSDGNSIDNPVAIKRLFIEATDDPATISRIKRAANIRIDHPGLLQIIDFIEAGKTFFVVSEYLKGQTLDQLISSNKSSSKQMDLSTVVDITKHIIDSLNALHQHIPQIVHRDIKPENIMVCDNGQIKLLDYGIAKVADKGGNNVTLDGSMMGTPAYLPLEQIRGLINQISPATDFYSVGILLYQLITNELPFIGSYFDVIKAHEEDEIPNNPKIPNSFYEVIKMATDKNPLNRYHKGDKFKKALDNALLNKSKVEKKSYTKIYKRIALFTIPVLMLIGAYFFINTYFSNINHTSEVLQKQTIEINIDQLTSLIIDTTTILIELPEVEEESEITETTNANESQPANNTTTVRENNSNSEAVNSGMSPFDILVNSARNKKAEGDCLTALNLYKKALLVKNDIGIANERDALANDCIN